MLDVFDSYEKAKIYYSVPADRLFLFHEATFLMLPCLEREDGKKLLLKSVDDIQEMLDLPDHDHFKLVYIGDL